jgi:hypothetical protein
VTAGELGRSDGSIAPLAIGLALISLATVLATSCATSFFLLERRLTTVAEFAALSRVEVGMAAIDYIAQGQPAGFKNLLVQRDVVSDGVTSEVVICATWEAPLPGFIQLPTGQLCAKGEARAG